MLVIILICILLFLTFLSILDKQNILYSFVFLYAILPEYLAIEISDSLPLLTASRIILILLILYALIKKGRIFNQKRSLLFMKRTKLYLPFVAFFICEIVVYVPYFSNLNSIKELILSFVEKFILVICISRLIDNEKQIEKCIRVIVLAAVLVSGVGIFENILGSNFVYYLNTASRELLMSSYERLGTLRAEVSFGHPISLSMYLLIIIPLVMYNFEKHRSNMKNGIILVLVVTCLLLTISRATIIIFFLSVPFIIHKKDKKSKRKYYYMLIICCLMMSFIYMIKPDIMLSFKSIVFATLNAIGFDFEVSDFGRNADANLSRLAQLSLVPYTLKTSPFWGGGVEYIFNNTVKLVYQGTVTVATSIDNEYIGILVEKGIIGLSCKVWLYMKLMLVSHKLKKDDILNHAFFYSFVTYFIGLFSVRELTTSKVLWVIIALFISYNSIKVNNLSIWKTGGKSK